MSPGAWSHPEWSGGVILAVALAGGIAVLSWLAARRRADSLLGSRRVVGARRLLRDLVLVAAFAALGVALVGPRWGTRTLLVSASGVDAVLLLDVSRSMDTRDVPPSRLVRARRAAARVLRELRAGDRAALAAFAGEGVLLTPLTPDKGALAEMLPALDTDLIAAGGSRLGAGIEAALEAFDPESARPRVVVVVSDGEDPAGAEPSGAAEARRLDVRVVAVSLGTDEGGTVPESGAPIRDDAGRLVVSRRDAARLADLAEQTGGAHFAADRWGEVDAESLLAAVRAEVGSEPGELVPREVAATRVAPLAALAFALLWLEWTGLPRVSRARRLAAAALAVATLGVLPGGGARATEGEEQWLEARLREHPGDARLLLALGLARAERGQRDAAAPALLGAAVSARDPELAAVAYYDLGVLELERREYEAARDAFLDALALDPERTDARFNLEWTLRAMRAEPPEPGGSHAPAEPEQAEGEDARPEPTSAEDPAKARPEPTGQDPAQRKRWSAELDPDAVQRWLDAVGDESGRALKEAAAERSSGRRTRGPHW